jgi:hypothetical protein
MTLLAVRAIDLAIFGTMGSLWVGGAIFIYVLYRWIAKYERGENTSQPPMPRPVRVEEPEPASPPAVPQTAAARRFGSTSEPALT